VSSGEIRAHIEAAQVNLDKVNDEKESAAAQQVLAASGAAQAQIAIAMAMLEMVEAVKRIAAQKPRVIFK
jgi:hypothetical protein